ncbi:MAG: AraC family transcriptional regulator [Candidatus Thiodiazotropha sp. 6PLUC2]
MTTQPKPTIADISDPIGEALHLLKLNGTYYCRSELQAPWGIELPPFEGHMMFHVVTRGECWLEVSGEEPHLLKQGSLALVPHGSGHTVRSQLNGETQPLFDIPVDSVSERYEIMRHGGDGELTQLTCGLVRFDHVAGQQIVTLLPQVLQIDTWKEEEGSWIQSTLELITREARELRPGGETVITRLADVLVIQAIRSWLSSLDEPDQNWLSALRDKHIGRALAAIHRYPEQEWTLAALATEARMSRSGFSARFTELVGYTAMHYVTRWRMLIARSQLAESSEPLVRFAERCGYRSEAAFCRAFKREFGVSPGSVRQKNHLTNYY